MKKNRIMTKDDYLKRHIPHRINLLLTFKRRFSNLTEKEMQDLGYRDFYRCSKDISMMMVRFLLGELGIRLGKNSSNISEITKNHQDYKELSKRWINFDIDRLTEGEIKKDLVLSNKVFKVLVAANHAIAHIDTNDVDHKLDNYDKTLEILIPTIDYTLNMVINNIYKSKVLYNNCMHLPDNVM